ncbi:MAG: PilN domain-containing protein [Candidatus Omnitrophota bacterium]
MNTQLILEIGSPWLKMVLFRAGLGSSTVKAVYAAKLDVFSEEHVTAQISAFLKKANMLKPHNIIISFSRNAVTLRNLRIPSANSFEIDDMIKLHVGRQVPYAKEEIVNGYRVTGKDNVGYSKVMLAVIHRESIRKIFRILEGAGLYTDKVELSSDGVLAWLCKTVKTPALKPTDAFIVLDVDFNFTDFIVATCENILFSRVVTQGYEQIRDESAWPKFIGEMKQSMVISQGEEIMHKPVKIYLTGAAGLAKGLAGKIEIEFNLPVEVVSPLVGLSGAKGIMKEPADIFDTVSVSALFGLGLDPVKKKINFVLPEAQIRKTLRERQRDLIFFGSAGMYLILVICGIYLEKMANRQSYLDLLKDNYRKISTQTESLNEKLERLKKIKSKLDIDATVINYVYEISRLIPSEIVLKNFDFEKDEKVLIKGRAREMSDVFKFITILEESPYLKDIQSRYMTRKKIQGKDVNEFELICLIEKPGEEKKADKSGKKGKNDKTASERKDES